MEWGCGEYDLERGASSIVLVVTIIYSVLIMNGIVGTLPAPWNGDYSGL
jgi:hypothetical protein